jgi:DedD protein
VGKEAEPIIHGNRKGLILYIGLLLFVAAWMFILGLLVGRGTAPVAVTVEKWKTELSERRARMLREGENSAEARASHGEGSKPELGFYEALKETAPGKKYTVDMPAAKPPSAAPAAVARPETRQPPPAAPEPQPVKRSPPAGKPSRAEPEDDASGRFTIQVAALKEARGAQRMVDDLRSKGYPAYHIRNASGRDVWFRVRVGAFKERADAEKLLKKLKNNHKINGLIVSSR